MEPEQIKTYVSLSQGTNEGRIIETIVPVSCVEDEHFLPDTSNCHLLTGSWKLRKKAKSNPEMQEAKKNSNELIKEGLRNQKQRWGFNQQIIQSLSHVQLFATPWTAACQASLSFTVSWSWLKLMSIEVILISSSVAPFSSGPQSFPVSGSFPMSWHFASGGQSIGISASASVLPMYIQGWFPLRLLVWSPCYPRDSQESSPTPQFKSINSWCSAFFMVQLSYPYVTTEKTIGLTIQTFVCKVMLEINNHQTGDYYTSYPTCHIPFDFVHLRHCKVYLSFCKCTHTPVICENWNHKWNLTIPNLQILDFIQPHPQKSQVLYHGYFNERNWNFILPEIHPRELSVSWMELAWSLFQTIEKNLD